MNARQAAKAAAKKIEELERYKAMCKRDITAYNLVILALIRGESPCEWCNDKEECELSHDKGCEEWMLKLEGQSDE